MTSKKHNLYRELQALKCSELQRISEAVLLPPQTAVQSLWAKEATKAAHSSGASAAAVAALEAHVFDPVHDAWTCSSVS